MSNTNVLDIIVYLAKELSKNASLNSPGINSYLSNFKTSEVSAALSYIYEKDELIDTIKAKKVSAIKHRVLHLAERVILSTEGYGFILELHNLHILTEIDVENIIETLMLTTSNRPKMITLDKVKLAVSNHLLKNKNQFPGYRSNLSGNESIN